jgi:hypothetical protein
MSRFVDLARKYHSSAQCQGNARVPVSSIFGGFVSNAPLAADRSPTLRSRVTNGKQLLANIDGRTADARRYRDLAASLADDLGGAANLTEAQRALVRQAAAMIIQSERLQSAILRGELIDSEQLTRLANAATRILSRLGIKRQRRDATPRLADILLRHAKPEAASA